MIPGLGTLVDRVSGIFGRGYLLAGFLPVLLLALLSLLAGYETSEAAHRRVDAYLAASPGQQALQASALLGLVAVAGFVFWSLNPWFRLFLEGQVLPHRMRLWLIEAQKLRFQQLQAELEKCLQVLADYREAHGPKSDGWLHRLRLARVAGGRTGVSPTPEPTAELIECADAAARAYRSSFDAPPIEVMNRFCDALEKELESCVVTGASRLDDVHEQFRDLADSAMVRAENACARTMTHLRARFPVDLHSVGPTRMANVAELPRDRALQRYGMDTELFWLHLQTAAAADEHFRPVLEESKTKLDTSVGMTVALALASLWAPVIAFAGHRLGTFLLFAVGVPAAAFISYQSATVNLRIFGDAVTAAVDLFRFELLGKLHVGAPADSAAERALWTRLTQRAQLLTDEPVGYVVP